MIFSISIKICCLQLLYKIVQMSISVLTIRALCMHQNILNLSDVNLPYKEHRERIQLYSIAEVYLLF
jgi:hypothetical protein